jgi:MOSC domain-containing protein YiiM
VEEVECVAGQGLVGDRFFGHKEGYKGQVTFFSEEVYQEAKLALGAEGREASAFRRNVLTRGADLNAWIGKQFLLQGILFEGVEECRPCYWMETAFAEGAEAFLKGRGGLRARILGDGVLRVNAPARAV